MSKATEAKSARARATIARNIYVNNRSGDFGRNRDDCFEMGDGDEVVRLLIERLPRDPEFRAAILRHWRSAPVKVLSAILEADTEKLIHPQLRAAIEAVSH